jgi:TrmH family RNA methyltransferase
MEDARLDNVMVVLQRPQDSRNIGAVMRAMKNMGIAHLRLVQPAPIDHALILRVAHGCEDLLTQMTIYDSLDGALADAHYVVGTAAIQHKARLQSDAIRSVVATWIGRLRQDKVALLFGQEDDGLDHVALDRCHLILTIPTNPAYPALNLAQSVLLLLYEVRMAVLTGNEVAPAVLPPVATQAELERLFQVAMATLETVGFFKGNRAAVMRKLRQILYKATLNPEETALLLAILKRAARGAI